MRVLRAESAVYRAPFETSRRKTSFLLARSFLFSRQMKLFPRATESIVYTNGYRNEKFLIPTFFFYSALQENNFGFSRDYLLQKKERNCQFSNRSKTTRRVKKRE